MKAHYWMISCDKTKFWYGLSKGPGLLSWIPEYSLGAYEKIYQWTTEEYVSGHIYLRKTQRVVCTQVQRKEGYEDIKNIILFILGYIFIKIFGSFVV